MRVLKSSLVKLYYGYCVFENSFVAIYVNCMKQLPGSFVVRREVLRVVPIDVTIVNFSTACCIEIPSTRPSIPHKKDVVIHFVSSLAALCLSTEQEPSNVRMIRGKIWASDNGVVIEFSRPRVLIRRTMGGEWNRLIHPFAIETASSPEHEACSGVNHVVVNIDRAGILVL